MALNDSKPEKFPSTALEKSKFRPFILASTKTVRKSIAWISLEMCPPLTYSQMVSTVAGGSSIPGFHCLGFSSARFAESRARRARSTSTSLLRFRTCVPRTSAWITMAASCCTSILNALSSSSLLGVVWERRACRLRSLNSISLKPHTVGTSRASTNRRSWSWAAFARAFIRSNLSCIIIWWRRLRPWRLSTTADMTLSCATADVTLSSDGSQDGSCPEGSSGGSARSSFQTAAPPLRGTGWREKARSTARVVGTDLGVPTLIEGSLNCVPQVRENREDAVAWREPEDQVLVKLGTSSRVRRRLRGESKGGADWGGVSGRKACWKSGSWLLPLAKPSSLTEEPHAWTAQPAGSQAAEHGIAAPLCSQGRGPSTQG
mmetsp:Transcript_80764/g.251864  ORF Transcript_80764/g.251864 Transcript_80764/m.251864 type:complete len:375 (+) Transcript_80764:767-1891(+)